MIDLLTKFKDRIQAIVYIRRESIPDILKELKSTDLFVIDLIKDILSHRKGTDDDYVRNLRKLHIDRELELRILQTITRSQDCLEKIPNKKKRLNPRRKRALKYKKEQASTSASTEDNW